MKKPPWKLLLSFLYSHTAWQNMLSEVFVLVTSLYARSNEYRRRSSCCSWQHFPLTYQKQSFSLLHPFTLPSRLISLHGHLEIDLILSRAAYFGKPCSRFKTLCAFNRNIFAFIFSKVFLSSVFIWELSCSGRQGDPQRCWQDDSTATNDMLGSTHHLIRCDLAHLVS